MLHLKALHYLKVCGKEFLSSNQLGKLEAMRIVVKIKDIWQMQGIAVKIFMWLSLALALMFIFVPALDLQASNLFYNHINGFFLKTHYIVLILFNSIYYITPALIVFFISALYMNNIIKKQILDLTNRKVLYLVAALAIGPGLVVNYGLKDHVGRARPFQIKEFGGTKTFTPAFIVTDHCNKNCSFTSGHASVGFYFSAFAFLSNPASTILLTISILFGLLIGLARIVQGTHFLSDVLFSGIFVVTINYCLSWIILGRRC